MNNERAEVDVNALMQDQQRFADDLARQRMLQRKIAAPGPQVDPWQAITDFENEGW